MLTALWIVLVVVLVLAVLGFFGFASSVVSRRFFAVNLGVIAQHRFTLVPH
jgi:hypothetical protein